MRLPDPLSLAYHVSFAEGGTFPPCIRFQTMRLSADFNETDGARMNGRSVKNYRYNVIETCVAVIAVIAVGFVLSKAASVAIPFLLAFLLSLFFFPVIKAGRKRHVPTSVMVLVVMLGIVAVLLPLGILLNVRLQGMMELLPGYYDKLVEIGKSLLVRANLPKDFWVTINWYNSVGKYLTGMTGFFLHWVANLLMVTVFLVFMLLESTHVEKRLRTAFKGDNGERVQRIGEKIVRQISRYLRTLALISLITGVCVWFFLRLIGVDFAMTWGVLAFFLNFIPTFGSIVASIPPVLVALVQFYPNWGPSVLTLVALLCIQFTIGNIVTPKVMGDTLDLSPVVILISLMFWGVIWGVSGALLSVPIAVMIKILCENVPKLHFLSTLMCSARNGCYSEEQGEEPNGEGK